MASRRSYEKDSDRLTALETQVDELREDVRELRSALKWQTRALIGAMLTMASTLAVALLVLPHG